jgi:hypothetical protein
MAAPVHAKSSRLRVMRTLVVVAVMGASSLVHADPGLSTARTVDMSSGLTLASPASDGGDLRPGVALGLRAYAPAHIYLSGALGAAVAADASDPESGAAATILSVGGGAGLYGETGGWTGYAGGRAEWVKSLDWPGDSASRDPDWFTSGVGAGPSLAIARRIGFAWGHPMAIELSASYMVYALRRPDVYVIQILPPPGSDSRPADLDGLQVGLFLAGTLFPDRPL